MKLLFQPEPKIIIGVLNYKVDGCVSLLEIVDVFNSILCRALDHVFDARIKIYYICPNTHLNFQMCSCLDKKKGD